MLEEENVENTENEETQEEQTVAGNEETPAQQNVIAIMTNLADSGQDDFVANWSEMAKTLMYEQGISNKYLNSPTAEYIIAKAVTDLIEDGKFTDTTISIINTLRVNHPHAEDDDNV